jgi:hypothetical protein
LKISDKLSETSLNQKMKIVLEANSNKINLLIKAYNGMVDELEKCHQISAKRARSLARNGETSGARNQELTPMR